MPDIIGNIRYLNSMLPEHVKLVAVSKTKPVSDILEAYNAGQRCFGENRVQEILNKKDLLPGDIEWHLIGHLQTNKVKYIVPFISMIQSVDSYKLLKIINTEACKIDRKADCLLQFHIAEEETKFGFSLNEAIEMLESKEFANLINVRICGVMGMATFTTDDVTVRKEFDNLAGYFSTLKKKYFAGIPSFKDISMGMSGDYETAVKAGTTIVRIGSLIFGERNYK